MNFSAKYFRVILLLPLLLVLGSATQAQRNPDSNSNSDSRPQLKNDEDDTFCRKTGDAIFDEMRIKACIKQQQKEFRELLDNGEEAVKLSSELEKTVEKSSGLMAEDQKKLERLEKLFKKIRNSLGGEDDEEAPAEEKPSSLSLKAAVSTLSEKASNLLAELKKTTRYSISVLAIQSSNTIIRLVKYIRFSKN